MAHDQPLVPAHEAQDESPYIAARFQHPCPRCLRTCVLTEDGILCDLSEQTVPVPVFAGDHRKARPGSARVGVRASHALLVHRCDPADVDRARSLAGTDPQDVAEDLDAARAGLGAEHEHLRAQYALASAQRQAAREHHRQAVELIRRAGLTRPCPRCGAREQEPCLNLLAARKGERVANKTLHPLRITTADVVSANELLASLSPAAPQRPARAGAQLVGAREEAIARAKAHVAAAYRSIADAQRALESIQALEASTTDTPDE